MLFGGFDLEAASAIDALTHCKTPVLFIHGGDDRFVPCEMVREDYEHCAAENKRLLIVPGAGHGLSYMIDRKAYPDTLNAFIKSTLE